MANKWLNTVNMKYNLNVGSIRIYDNSIQEITAEQYTALSSNAVFSDMVAKGNIVVSNSQPSESNSECFIRPLSGDITLNGMPVNNDGVPSITLGEVIKEIDNIENNKSVEVDVSTYSAPIVVNPSEGKDAMKKTTVSLSNIPKLSHARCWKKDGVPFYFDFKEAVDTDDAFKEAYSLTPTEFINLVQIDDYMTAISGCYSSKLNLHVAISSYAETYYSEDRIHWTQAETATGYLNFQSAYWDSYREKFIFVGNNSSGKALIRTSTDGVNYTDTALTDFGQLWSICANSTVIVAVGESGLILTSTDAETWTSRTSGVSSTLKSVCYNEDLGVFCAVGGSTVLISADGVTWVDQNVDVTNGAYNSVVAYTGTTFVASNQHSNYSELLIGEYNDSTSTWTWTEVATSKRIYSIYNWKDKDILVAVTDSGLFNIVDIFNLIDQHVELYPLYDVDVYFAYFYAVGTMPFAIEANSGIVYSTAPVDLSCTLSKNKTIYLYKTYVKNNANSFSLTQEYVDPETYTRYADGDIQLQ